MSREIIYKYGPFNIGYGEAVEFQGEPIHVGSQDDTWAHEPNYRVFLWCKLDADYPVQTKRHAKIVGTGELFSGKYIGTTVLPTGFVWHVVEVE
jgi:hypothetical protein